MSAIDAVDGSSTGAQVPWSPIADRSDVSYNSDLLRCRRNVRY